MKTNLDQHFKERDPKETIKIIQDFFIKRGFTFRQIVNLQSEIGTYSNRVELVYNGYTVLGSNGKGMTLDYCLASCYSEMYERFCALCHNGNNKFLTDIILENTQLPKISYTDILNIPMINDYFSIIYKNNLNKVKDFFQARYGQLYGNQFINLYNDNDIKLIDNRIVNALCGSTGLAAGNTIDEALNQGLSEWFERYTGQQFFIHEQEHYYCIDKKYIKNLKLLEIINNFEILNYKYYIIDLSYNFNCPVLMSVLINPEHESITVNFGSFPVFDIALERILTELYQGIASFSEQEPYGLIPYKKINIISTLNQGITSFNFINTFNETFFDKLIYTDFNKKIFINEPNTSNKEIKEQIKIICKTNNFQPYYLNLSLIPEMTTIRILMYNKHFQEDKLRLNYNDFDILTIHNQLINFYNFIDLIQNNIKNSILINYFKKNCLIDFNDQNISNIFADIIQKDIFNPLHAPNIKISTDNLSYEIFSDFFNIESKSYFGTIHYKYIKKYINLINYINSHKYTKEEIIKFFKEFFNEDIIEEDFLNINNSDYLFEQIFINPIKNLIFSKEYKKLIKLITMKE